MAHEVWHMIHEELIVADSLTQHKYTNFLICLHRNYVNYAKTRFDFEIDGTLSLSEQMADTFGILASLKAYLKEFKASNGGADGSDQHKLLPGLKYNHKKLFFIRYAQSYCRKRKITGVKQFEQFHVIHEYRAFQPSLIPEFGRAFKCKADKKSNVKTCNIFKIK